MNLLFRVLPLAFFLPCGAYADAIDDYLQKQMQRNHVPGMAVAIVRNGQVVKLGSYGTANLEWNSAVSKDTAFQIASSTKPFTGIALMQLVEAGRLSLSDPITKYLPHAPEAWRGITVRHVATHTSGIPESEPGAAINTLDQAIEKVSQKPLAHQPPGERAVYGLVDFAVLARVMEQASGKSYQQLLQDGIFSKLGLHSAQFSFAAERGPRRVANVIPKRASVYLWEEGRNRISDFFYPAWTYNAGGLYCSVADLAAVMASLHQGQLLKPETVEQMWQRTQLADGSENPFAVGWTTRTYAGRQAVGHTGGPALSDVLHFPEEKLSIIVLTNQHKLYPYLAEGIADQLLQRRGPVQPTITDDDAALAATLRTLISEASTGKVEDRAFTTDAVQSVIPMLRDVGPMYLGSLAPLRAFELVKKDKDRREYRALFGDKPVLFQFRLAPDRRIADLEITAQ